VADLYGEMTDGINRGHVAFEHGTKALVRGPTTLETVLRSLLKR
jgi:predicted GNAT superfamily acetyltransferase